MAGDSSMPDFEDLLAAYDIPDVTVRIREATTDDEPATTDADGNNDENKVDSTTDNVPVQGDSSASTVTQNGGTPNKESDTANGSQPFGQESNRSDQAESKETVSETSPVQTPDSISKVAKITIPISSISPEQDQKTLKLTREFTIGTNPQKLLIRRVLSPTSTAQGLGFKNTSSDGPKILNVSGGIGNIITIPQGTTANSSKSGQVVIKKVVPISTSQKGSGPPTIFRAITTNANNSKMTVSPVFKPTVGPLYRISAVAGDKGSQSDPYEEEIINLSKKQLDRTNPIQTYTMTPPPEELELDIPVGGYKCEECGDSYALKSSLEQHMQRRSVKIVMNCNLCHSKYKLEFYNKCSMHAHVRSHNTSTIKPVLDAVVSPLDSLSIGPRPGRPKGETKKPSSDQEQETEGEKTSAVKSLLQQARQRFEDRLPKEHRIPSHITLESLESNKCPVCLESVGSRTTSLAAHFQTLKLDQQYSCEHCGMVLVNFCQLVIHIKVHASVSPPWICPECARVFTDFSIFEEHINQTCLHFNRNAAFQCTLCTKIQKSLSAYKVHLLTVHKHSFYKCLNCQLAFRSVDALKVHSSSQHKYTGAPLCSIISKCPLCDTVFTQNSMLVSHLTSHINNFLPSKFQYLCSECPFVTVGIVGLQAHYSQYHNKRRWWFCDLCLHKFQTREHVRTHRAAKHKRYASIEQKSSKGNGNSLPNGADHKETAGVSNSIEQGKAADSTDGKTSQLNSSNDKKESTKVIIKRMLRCPGCKALGVDIYFKKERNLRNHIVRSHAHIDPNSIQPEHIEYVPFVAGKGNAKVGDQDESGGTDVHIGHKRKRSQEAEASANRIKKLREDKLSCAKCDFESKDRIEFSSHIDEHRGDNHVSQCQECGTCFRVEDSLHKHLFVSHQIRDITAYAKFQMEVQESIDKAKLEKMKEMSERDKAGSPANPLECKVCYKVFDNDVMLKNHMRSHGMAFIRAKNKTV